eukprot:g53040.t1
MSTGKLRDELYCIERKIQTGRKNLFKKKEMLETVLKAVKAGSGGPHIYTDPKTKTTIHCVSKEEKDARGNVYTAWLKVENDCNLFQDHWVVFVDKRQLEKAEERERKKREILSRADPVRYSAAMKEKVQQFLHLKVGEENVESAWRGDHSKLVVNDKEGRDLFTSAANARRAELDQQGHQRFKLEGFELQTLVDKFRELLGEEGATDPRYEPFEVQVDAFEVLVDSFDLQVQASVYGNGNNCGGVLKLQDASDLLHKLEEESESDMLEEESESE